MNTERVANHIVDWLNKYIENTSIQGFILGISGGVDSAVVANLCARTQKNVLLLSLPIHQASSEHSRANKQIVELINHYPNVYSLEIDLTSTFDEFVKSMPKTTQEDQLSLANVRSRLRMVTLYAVGQTNRLLVTGTGNKVEDFGIGFFTKYGDGGVDINPIGDLMKSEVYELGKYLGVIDEILQARPTDGLWGDNRTDEDQIGATYDELEFAMQYNGAGEELTERQKEVSEIYKRLNRINQHKFNPIPVCKLDGIR